MWTCSTTTTVGGMATFWTSVRRMMSRFASMGGVPSMMRYEIWNQLKTPRLINPIQLRWPYLGLTLNRTLAALVWLCGTLSLIGVSIASTKPSRRWNKLRYMRLPIRIPQRCVNFWGETSTFCWIPFYKNKTPSGRMNSKPHSTSSRPSWGSWWHGWSTLPPLTWLRITFVARISTSICTTLTAMFVLCPVFLNFLTPYKVCFMEPHHEQKNIFRTMRSRSPR